MTQTDTTSTFDPVAVTGAQLRAAIKDLGLSARPVCLHASLRSLGAPVEDGATGVVQAFLDEGCTVLVPAFTWSYAVPPPVTGPKPERNGWDYDRYPGPTAGIGRIYSRTTTECDDDMGVVAKMVAQWPGRARGDHPLNSLAAIGPLAAHLVAGQSPADIYAPLRALAQADGIVLLLGVGLTRLTLLHLAECQAGRELFRRWANRTDGRPVAVEVGGCSAGFDQFGALLEPVSKSRMVGESLWRAYPATAVLECAISAIQTSPWITYCNCPDCERCRDAIAGGPVG